MALSIKLDLQSAVNSSTVVPEVTDVQTWVAAVLQGRFDEPVELTIRIVEESESAQLNETYRNKQGSTNVLSFPYDGEIALSPVLLGDVVVCAPVVINEARVQGKSLKSHWCHMIIHGVLHLLGYDHITDQEAEEMEAEEVSIMAALQYDNPYK